MSMSYYCKFCNEFIIRIAWVDNEQPEDFDSDMVCDKCKITQ